MIDDLGYTDLIDEVGVTFDKSHSLNFAICFAGSLSIELDVQCSAVRRPNGSLASLRIVGLKMHFRIRSQVVATDQEVQLLALGIRGFHSVLPEFPHLRVAELLSPLYSLQQVVEFAPDVSQPPTLGAQVLYSWASLYYDIPKAAVDTTYMLIGIDPATLELNGMVVLQLTYQTAIDDWSCRTSMGSLAALNVWSLSPPLPARPLLLLPQTRPHSHGPRPKTHPSEEQSIIVGLGRSDCCKPRRERVADMEVATSTVGCGDLAWQFNRG